MGASLACMRKSDRKIIGSLVAYLSQLYLSTYHGLSLLIYLLLPQDSEISQHRSDVYMMSTDLWHGHLF
jgi:hypothetical protein